MPLPPYVQTVQQAVSYFETRDASRETRLLALELASQAPVLKTLTLSANTISEGALAGVLIGNIGNETAGSTLSFASDDGGRFSLSGDNLIRGLTNLDYDAGPTRNIVVRETLAGAVGSPKDTPFQINVTPVDDTLANTLGTSSTLGNQIQNYGSGYADQLRAIAAQKGFTFVTTNNASAADFVAECEAALLNYETPRPKLTLSGPAVIAEGN